MANRKNKAARRTDEYTHMASLTSAKEHAVLKAEMEAIKRELAFKYSRWRWRAFQGIYVLRQQPEIAESIAA